MPDLISSTLEAMTIPGMSSRDAAREMLDGIRADLGISYDVNRLGQWRRGERAIPQPVQDWMLRACIAYAIHHKGGVAPIGDEQLDELAAMLCPPIRPKK